MKTHTLCSSRLPGRLLLLISLLVGLGLLASRATPAHAATTLTVTNCSNDSQLQTDVSTANSDNDGDTITFSCGSNVDILLTNSLSISGSMSIDGGQSVTLDGSREPSNILNVSSGITFTLTAIVIANDASFGGGGGLINNGGTVNIINSTFANNSIFGGDGGGLINDGGTVNITNSTFANNTANSYSGSGGDGGGLWNDLGGTVNITNSTFANNATHNSGSGGDLNGGGLYNHSGTVNIINSTFANNTAASGSGGGLYNSGTINIANSTIANSTGTGIYVNLLSPVSSKGSIVAGNTEDCYDPYGAIVDNGYNMDGDGLCFGASTSLHGNPQLSALANHGGPTQTMALQANSPAIDAIPLADCVDAQGNPLTTDQRGAARPDDGESFCDIGAYESGSIALSSSRVSATEGKAFSGTVATGYYDGSGTLSASISWGDGSTSSGTFTASTGSFSVSGSHTYKEEGSYTLQVTISDGLGTSVSTSEAVTVADAALTLKSLTASVQGHKMVQASAHFVDANPKAKVSDYTANISWGDNTSSPVTVSKNPSGNGFVIAATHTYAAKGSYTITLTVLDKGGSQLSKTVTFTVK